MTLLCNVFTKAREMKSIEFLGVNTQGISARRAIIKWNLFVERWYDDWQS